MTNIDEIVRAHEADLVSRAPCGMICHAQTILDRESALIAKVRELEKDNASLHNAIKEWHNKLEAADNTVAQLEKDKAGLVEALRDMLSGWKYIRQVHGDLYGVGWDRAQQKAESALKQHGGEKA